MLQWKGLIWKEFLWSRFKEKCTSTSSLRTNRTLHLHAHKFSIFKTEPQTKFQRNSIIEIIIHDGRRQIPEPRSLRFSTQLITYQKWLKYQHGSITVWTICEKLFSRWGGDGLGWSCELEHRQLWFKKWRKLLNRCEPHACQRFLTQWLRYHIPRSQWSRPPLRRWW